MSMKSSHGTFRSPQQEESSGAGFRIMTGLVGFVILMALIATATVLLKVRNDLFALKVVVAGGASGAAKVDDEQMGALRAEMAALRDKLEESTRGEAASEDRFVIKQALAKLLHQHEAGSTEVSDLIGGLTGEQRLAFMSELGAADPTAGHGALRKEIASIHKEGSNGNGENPEPPTPTPTPPNPTPPNLTPTPPNLTPTPPNLTPTPPNLTPTPPNLTPTPPESEPLPGPAPAPANFKEYTVVSGDTMSRIARKHGVTLEAIAKANGISDPNKIGVGDVLKIPLK
jgi:nucleoid-associated protein YgaU